MTVLDIIEKRYSVRGYEDRPVEDEKLQQVLKAAQLAPTGVNSQAFKIYVIDTKKHEQKLREVYDNDWFVEAPIVLAVVSKANDAWTRPWDLENLNEIDATIVMDHMILTATELGLGTCMMGWFKEKDIKKILEIPDKKEVHLVISLGYYENKEPRKKVRKEINEIFSYNKYE